MKTIAAGIFVVRKDGKLLICHPTNHAPDFWSIPKGKVEKGETMLEGALRETYEETNLFLNDNEFFKTHELAPINYNHKKKILHPFLFHEKHNSPLHWPHIDIKCNSNVPKERGGFPEMDDYRWVDIDEAKKLLHETQVACLDNIKKLINEI